MRMSKMKINKAVFIVALLPLFSLSTGCSPVTKDAYWTQQHIIDVPPIFMIDPFLEQLGQAEGPIPYYYKEVVKMSGHSCGAISGAWIITQKALAALYPGETPVRGQILVEAPGAEDEWLIGVFGEVITYITGAAPKTGFPGAGFAKGSKRRNLMRYKETATHTPPPQMVWLFTRLDTGAQAGVSYNLSLIQPPATPEYMKTGEKMAQGKATAEEINEWRALWNARIEFVFDNADRLEGLFTVDVINNE